MKKSLVVLVSILVIIYAVFTILDTSEYRLEKRIYRLQQEYARITTDPKVIPATEFDALIKRYQALIAKYPDSNLIPNMYIYIGYLYDLKGDKDKAIETFMDILTRYKDNRILCSMALLNAANTYANMGDEAKTIATFNKITREYPDTDVGFNVPLLVSNYYLNKKDTLKYKKALLDAVEFYMTQAQQNPGSVTEFNALRLLVTVYYTQENWAKAVNVLSDILLKYAKSNLMNQQRAALFIRSINTICMTKLNDYRRAEGIYKRFLEENPGHPLTDIMQKMLEAIKTLKDRNVQVVPEKK